MAEQFILASDAIRVNAVNAINGLDLTKKKWSVEIKQFKSSRSNAQNRLYWKWVGIIANDAGYSTDELHEIFKAMLLGIKYTTFAGKKVPIANSTANLNVEQFTNYLTKIEEAAKHLGVILPRPDDYRFAMYGEK